MKKILVISLVAVLFACESKKVETSAEESKPEQSFETFKADYIDAMWQMNPISASYQGVHDYDNQLPILDEKRDQAELEFANQWLTSLEEFDYESLSELDQIDFHLIKDNLASTEFYINEFKAGEWNPSSYNLGGPFFQVINYQGHDLEKRLDKIDSERWHVGVASTFSNANSCVNKKMIDILIGNDVNFDGGYGEDGDFGLSIIKKGGVLLHNPFSPILHLKPPEGGYRWWGVEAKKTGKKRKKQPWELDNPVKLIKPVPSPTITYGLLKHFTKDQIKEWRIKHFFIYLFKTLLSLIVLY